MTTDTVEFARRAIGPRWRLLQGYTAYDVAVQNLVPCPVRRLFPPSPNLPSSRFAPLPKFPLSLAPGPGCAGDFSPGADRGLGLAR
jgi:hypothetical protein